MERKSGILMPVFSLPSKYGIGALDSCAYNFIDFLERAGQHYWQILPINPTGFGNSPYQSFSAFAGNPYFVGLEELIDEEVLTEEMCQNADFGSDKMYIDYGKLYKNRNTLLREAYKNSNINQNREYLDFVSENSEWLEDYTLFMALKTYFNELPWYRWDEGIRLKKSGVVEQHRQSLEEEINFYKYIQFIFYRQWEKVRKYANSKGIRIVGDMPIYTALDSADVWSNTKLFQMEDGLPKAVAGCPPDRFSPKGQMWGNPLYDWDEHRKNGYKWWIKRLESSFRLYDELRVDHFRGFDEYYSIRYGAEDATQGHWEQGPGQELFARAFEELGKKKIIAEDLGFISDGVRKLLSDCGFPGMRVLEFAFDLNDQNGKNIYLPHNYIQNTIAYTGTHDNQTIVSWYKTLNNAEKTKVRNYLCDYSTPDNRINIPLIGLIMRSCAKTCIIPIQDYLGLEDEARINKPSTADNNWRWRISEEMLSCELAEKIKRITLDCGRM